MLSKSAIKRRALPGTYAMGKELWENDSIIDMNIDVDDYMDIIVDLIEGEVQDEDGTCHEVKGEYNHENQKLEIACHCPAHGNSDGLCKHCVAVLLEYVTHRNDYLGYDDDLDDDELWREDEDIYAQLVDKMLRGYTPEEILRDNRAKAPVMTTPIFKELLEKENKKRSLPLALEEEFKGKIRLEPFLTISPQCEVQLSYKIGITQMYVLKNVYDFYRNITNHEMHSYGQKLKFVHSLEAFTEEDRPQAEFICNWVTRYGTYMARQRYYGYYSSQKSIELDGNMFSEWLDLMGSRQFMGEVMRGGEKLWQVTSEKLPRELTIKGKKEGIEISLKYFQGIRCEKETVYFTKGKVYRCPQEEMAAIQDFLNCMANIPDRMAFIANKDVPSFCRNLLPELEKHYQCHFHHFSVEQYGIVNAEMEIYLDAPQEDWMTCSAEAVYGEKRYNIYDEQTDKNLRDMPAEHRVMQVIMSYATSYDHKNKEAVISDEEKMYHLLTEGIEKLSTLGQVFISDKLKRMTVKEVPKVTVGVSVSEGLLEISMLSDDLSQEELLELLNRYKHKRKFYRLKNGEFIKAEGEVLETLGELNKAMQLSENGLKNGKVHVPKYRALYLDSQLKANQDIKSSKDKAFKELIRHMKTVEDNDFEVPKELEKIMREYQKIGFLWLKTLKHNGFGGILADDMGLGKTLQVIAFLLSEQMEAKAEDNKKALIVAPASLVYNWKAEFERFAPSLSVKVIAGTAKERKQMLEELEDHDIVVTSYNLLIKDIGHYDGLTFATQVIDEGQYIKNHGTLAAKAVKRITADFKIALTGTPIENRLSELWSLFDYLMPGFLYAYPRFKEDLEQPIVQKKDKEAVARLQKMIQPFVLRRLKKEVLTDLPDKLEENKYVNLRGEQQKLYDANVKKLKIMLEGQSEESFNKSKLQILSELTGLREICCDPGLIYEGYKGESAKLDMCMELVENAVNSGHKVLLFSQFTSMLAKIEERLKKEKIKYFLLTGATPKLKRLEMVNQFNSEEERQVFCISLKAGGTGLNLTSADIVIHYDPWWNVAVQNQATDRAHRIGQENVVTVYKLIAKGTIEEKIIAVQESKKELADEILSGEGMKTGSFTKEDLIELLS